MFGSADEGMEGDFECVSMREGNFCEYDRPVPGIPTVACFPFFEILTDAPGFPMVTLLSPFLEIFSLIPGIILILLLNRNDMISSNKV